MLEIIIEKLKDENFQNKLNHIQSEIDITITLNKLKS